MEYTPAEREILSFAKRKDFKNLSKNDFIAFVSNLNEVRPEVAKEIIAQFPEFKDLLSSTFSSCVDSLKEITKSDDSSLNQVYHAADRQVNAAESGRKEFFTLAKMVLDDCSKCITPGMPIEEAEKILDREFEVLKISDKKDSEIRQQEKEAIHIVKEKDSEKRRFNWGTLGLTSALAASFAALGIVALGGKMKLPNFGNQTKV